MEALHSAEWGPQNPVLKPPGYGNIAEIENSLILEPPKGMEIGYVPIALCQHDKRYVPIRCRQPNIFEQENSD